MIDIRRRSTEHRSAAEGTRIAITQVVDKHDQDVWLAAGLRLEIPKLLQGCLLLRFMRNRGLEVLRGPDRTVPAFCFLRM